MHADVTELLHANRNLLQFALINQDLKFRALVYNHSALLPGYVWADHHCFIQDYLEYRASNSDLLSIAFILSIAAIQGPGLLSHHNWRIDFWT